MILRACATSSALGENIRVARLDLVRMDQRLAVEAHVAALLAFGLEARDVAAMSL